LEKSFLSEDINEVEIEFGRYTASASGRWMQAYYWRENKWPLVRGTWFWKDPIDGSICPFGEADAATIEEAFRDISSGEEEGPIDCELVDTDIVSGTVQFVKEKILSSPVTSSSTLSPSPTIEKVSTRVTHCLYRQIPPGFSRSDRVETFRGYPVEWVGRAEESLENNHCVAHLVLVVHGIGEALHNRQNDPFMGSLRFRGHCDLFRDNLNNRLLESSGENKTVINGRIEVLPVEWAECIHNNTLDRRMESVTIPNLQGVRDFANLALSDVFLYTQSEVKDKISKFITMRIEYILKRFLARHPLQQQKTIVSFVGHSLVSVVLYDMFNGHLARKTSSSNEEDPPMNQFLISPAALFFLGSPLALFQTIRDPSVSESPRHVMDLPCRVFNIFHPYDAIAYRVEPLIDTRMKDVEPILVPHRGGHRVHVAIKKSITDNTLKILAKTFRKDIFIFKTNSGFGHLASSLSCVDILVSLFFDPASNFDLEHDRVIFGKGHGSPAIYPILAELGYFSRDELNKYCKPNGILRMHADYSIPGCNFVGGSLGNAIGFAAGLAVARPWQKFIVILGDAELYEGSIWESLIFISHHQLTNITIIVDRNKFGILGNTEKGLKLEPLVNKFEAFGNLSFKKV
jgi:transketolase